MAYRGASAEAFTVVSRVFDDALGSASLDLDGRVGGDLFSVAQVLRHEPALRRVVTDQRVAAAAQVDLARQLFSSRVDPASQQVIEAAFGERWTAVRDLSDTLEHFSVVALVRSAGEDSERLSNELFSLTQLVQQTPDLRDALSDPVRSVEDKSALLDRLLADKALPATLTLAKQALAGTYRTVSAALSAYQKVAADEHDKNVAVVRVATPLSDDDRSRLGRALAHQYGRDVHLDVIVDPDVVGGIRVEIGDDVIDGTISSRLADAQRKLAG